MSGGSWEYVYGKFEDVASRLKHDGRPKRRALGRLIAKIAVAMHDIEWVDSGDYSSDQEDEAIDAVVSPKDVLEEATEQANKALKDLQDALAIVGKSR